MSTFQQPFAAPSGGAASAAITSSWPVVVIGAGAAGLLAALFAARGGARVLLLETRSRPGAKIRASGGGRCNVLPSAATSSDFYTQGSSKTVRNVLSRWPLEAVRYFFETELGLPLVQEASGKLFPASNRAKDVVDALLAAVAAAGVQLQGSARVTVLHRVSHGYRLQMATGADHHATRVILAPGGMSLPKTGSDGGGWALARRLGHTLVPDAPALVPLWTATPALHDLAGLSLPATLVARDAAAGAAAAALLQEKGDLLFTHRGLSGPAALNVSRVFAQQQRRGGPSLLLYARWASAQPWATLLLQRANPRLGSLLRQQLPRRLADHLLTAANLDQERPLATLTRPQRQALLAMLDAYPLPVVGDDGYRSAEVTTGGVPLAEVVTKTLESRCAPGLHLAGEVLDVTGRLGGYNFLWAWVSGRIAGEAAARSLVAE